MTFPPSAGAGPGEHQIILFSPKTQKAFGVVCFCYIFLSSQKNRGLLLTEMTPLSTTTHTRLFSMTISRTESWQGSHLHVLKHHSAEHRDLCWPLSSC